MMHRRLTLALCWAILACCMVGLPAMSAASPDIDLRRFWEQRCQDCHGPAGDFARRHLGVENGQLVGRHHRRDLARFLRQHEMGPQHADDIMIMLLGEALAAPLFQQRCGRCHQSLQDLARSSIVPRIGVPVARSSGKPLPDFLQQHARLQPEDTPVIVDMLTKALSPPEPAPAQ